MRRKSLKYAAVLAAALSAGSAGASGGPRHHGEGERAKNVIVMVPDGMGLADVMAKAWGRGRPGSSLQVTSIHCQ